MRGQIRFDPTVFEPDDPLAMRRHVALVSYEDDCLALSMELFEEGHQLTGRGGVEIPRRFISEQDCGIIENRPGDRDALFLSAGELVGAMSHTVGQSDALKRACGLAPSSPPGMFGVDERHFHVFQRRHSR